MKNLFKRASVFVVIIMTVAMSSSIAQGESAKAPPEFRAAWMSRFGWPDSDPDKCRQNITSAFDRLAAVNVNAVVFQVRGQADVLYPSRFEPWSPLIGSTDPGWDPLAFAIEELLLNITLHF